MQPYNHKTKKTRDPCQKAIVRLQKAADLAHSPASNNDGAYSLDNVLTDIEHVMRCYGDLYQVFIVVINWDRFLDVYRGFQVG